MPSSLSPTGLLSKDKLQHTESKTYVEKWVFLILYGQVIYISMVIKEKNTHQKTPQQHTSPLICLRVY